MGTDPTGTTVYLGGFELRRTADGVSCTRYYGVAVRTPGGLVWQASDHHGTAQLSIKADDLGTTRRRLDPFGNPRSTPLPAWPTTRGFVNGTADPSGLTHLGAREYDPAIGRFISVDPLMDTGSPQQMNGYTYANNTPVTASDPDGLMVQACIDTCKTKVEKDYNRAERQKQVVRNRVKAPAVKPPAQPKTVKQRWALFRGLKDGAKNYAGDTIDGLIALAKDPMGAFEQFLKLQRSYADKYGEQAGWVCALTAVCAIYEAIEDGDYYTAGYEIAGLLIDLAVTAAGAAAGGAGSFAGAGTRASRLASKLGGGDALLSKSASGAGGKLPMTMECVCRTANKYGIDISSTRNNIYKSKMGCYGSTAPDGTVTLTRDAFRNEEQLARTLAHERFHVDQIRSGMGYPRTYDAGNVWESAAQRFEDNWWASTGSGLK